MPFCNAVDQGTPAKIIESLNFTQERPVLDEEELFPDELNMAGSSASFESIQIPTLSDFSGFLPESINVQDYHNSNAMPWHSSGSSGTHVPTHEGAPSGAPLLSYPRGDYEEGETPVSWHRWGRSSPSEKAQMLPSYQPDEVKQQAGDACNAIQPQ